MSILVIGAGAFGTGLAIALGHKGSVVLWGRDSHHVAAMERDRENTKRLPGASFPGALTVTNRMTEAGTVLLAVPMQQLSSFLVEYADVLAGANLVACCKGVDQNTGLGPVEIIQATVPSATASILTGPSFAADIAAALPTALTLACADDAVGGRLQAQLSTPVLRIYRTSDTIGAELGGALKNVMAIACGVTIGAGFGHSARAALMTRGFAEISRFAVKRGADAATLVGLSGFGDLVLTCTSDGSRNYQFGVSLGSNRDFDPRVTVEGAATSLALRDIAMREDLDMPITMTVAALVENKIDVQEAMTRLMSRPLKEE